MTRPALCLHRGSIPAGPGRWMSTASGVRTHMNIFRCIRDVLQMTNETQIRQVERCHISDLHLSEWAASAALVSWRRTQTHQLSALRASFRSWRLLQWRFLCAQHQHCRGTKQTTKSSADASQQIKQTDICACCYGHSTFPIWHTKWMFYLKYIKLHRNWYLYTVHTSVKAQQIRLNQIILR